MLIEVGGAAFARQRSGVWHCKQSRRRACNVQSITYCAPRRERHVTYAIVQEYINEEYGADEENALLVSKPYNAERRQSVQK